MADSKRLLMHMARRLYDDIKFVAEQNPKEIVDDDGTSAYNALLFKARRHFADVENVADFPDWSARTIKYKDALVVAGQFCAMLEILCEGDQAPPAPSGRVAQSAAASSPAAENQGRNQGQEEFPPPPPPANRNNPEKAPTRFDQELYGNEPPSELNDDGTIPFTLE